LNYQFSLVSFVRRDTFFQMELLLFWSFIPLSIGVIIASVIWIFRNRKGGKKFKLAGACTGIAYIIVAYSFIFSTVDSAKERMILLGVQFLFITLPWAGVIALVCLSFIFLNLFLKKEWIRNMALFCYSGILVVLIEGGIMYIILGLKYLKL